MAARYSLVIGFGALLGVGWLLPVAQTPPDHLPLAHARSLPDSDTNQWAQGEVREIDPPFREKLRRNGFRSDLDSLSYVNELTTFQEVCKLLGCTVGDFSRLKKGLGFSILPPVLDRSPNTAWHFHTKDIWAQVWLYDPDHPADKLGEATVRASIMVFRK